MVGRDTLRNSFGLCQPSYHFNVCHEGVPESCGLNSFLDQSYPIGSILNDVKTLVNMAANQKNLHIEKSLLLLFNF